MYLNLIGHRVHDYFKSQLENDLFISKDKYVKHSWEVCTYWDFFREHEL